MSPVDSMALLSVEDVSLFKGGRRILEAITFSIAPQEVISLIGPNGAGKSSLAKLILGFEKLTSGCIRKRSDLKMAYLPQNSCYNGLAPLTVEAFLQLHPRGKVRDQVHWVCEQVGLGPKQFQQPVKRLSGGERQRLFLARALLNQPDLIVLDEPSCSLDAQGQRELHDLLVQVRQRLKCAVLLISHDMHLVLANTDRVICLNGLLACCGTPEALDQQADLNHFLSQTHLTKPYLAAYRHRHLTK